MEYTSEWINSVILYAWLRYIRMDKQRHSVCMAALFIKFLVRESMSARHFSVLHSDTVMATSMNRHKPFTATNVLTFLSYYVGLRPTINYFDIWIRNHNECFDINWFLTVGLLYYLSQFERLSKDSDSFILIINFTFC